MDIKDLRNFLRCLITSIIEHKIVTLAAAIAFYGFSAMIPLILLIIYGTSLFIPQTIIQEFLARVLQSYVPNFPDAKVYLVQNIARLAMIGSKVGFFGILGLFWTSISGFVSFQQILDVILGLKKQRSFPKQYLVAFGMLGILLLLTVLSSFVSIILPLLIQNFLKDINVVAWLAVIHLISSVSFPLLLFLTCFVCYRFLPSQPLKTAYLLAGALTATVAIYVSREAFVWYTYHLGQYEMIYGSLTFIMLFSFWVYIVSIIVLVGAEVAVTLRNFGQDR